MKKTVLLVSLLVILLCCAIVAFAAPAATEGVLPDPMENIDLTAEGKPYVVTLQDKTSHLNIRSDKTVSSERIGALDDGATVKVYGVIGNWAVIKLDSGEIAYVHILYLTKVEEPSVTLGTVATIPTPTPTQSTVSSTENP